jgi:hypothetical protein
MQWLISLQLQSKSHWMYSQHFILFVTYELTQKARVLNYRKLEKLVREKHSSLLEQFVSYEKNEGL